MLAQSRIRVRKKKGCFSLAIKSLMGVIVICSAACSRPENLPIVDSSQSTIFTAHGINTNVVSSANWWGQSAALFSMSVPGAVALPDCFQLSRRAGIAHVSFLFFEPCDSRQVPSKDIAEALAHFEQPRGLQNSSLGKMIKFWRSVGGRFSEAIAVNVYLVPREAKIKFSRTVWRDESAEIHIVVRIRSTSRLGSVRNDIVQIASHELFHFLKLREETRYWQIPSIGKNGASESEWRNMVSEEFDAQLFALCNLYYATDYRNAKPRGPIELSWGEELNLVYELSRDEIIHGALGQRMNGSIESPNTRFDLHPSFIGMALVDHWLVRMLKLSDRRHLSRHQHEKLLNSCQARFVGRDGYHM